LDFGLLEPGSDLSLVETASQPRNPRCYSFPRTFARSRLTLPSNSGYVASLLPARFSKNVLTVNNQVAYGLILVSGSKGSTKSSLNMIINSAGKVVSLWSLTVLLANVAYCQVVDFSARFGGTLLPSPGYVLPYGRAGYISVGVYAGPTSDQTTLGFYYSGAFFAKANSKEYVISPSDNSFSVALDVYGRSEDGVYGSVLIPLPISKVFSELLNDNVNIVLKDVDGNVQGSRTMELLPEPKTYSIIGAGLLGAFAFLRRPGSRQVR